MAQFCVDDAEFESQNPLEEAGHGVYVCNPSTERETGQSLGLAGQHPATQ